ncbi:MAG: YlxR family protein [Acutalibacteraceae bacterium]|nr:YlxR family protein [Acutalibacteraceae bacterium]
MGTKKIPMRMCTGCREMKPKKELIRVVKTSEGEIKLDTTGKLNGRGAYICRDRQCFNNAKKSNALARAFEMKISDEIYTQLETELENIE